MSILKFTARDYGLVNVEFELPTEKLEQLFEQVHGNAEYGWGAVEFRFGPRRSYACLVVNKKEGCVFLEVDAMREGEERLDGTDFSPGEMLWVNLIPVARAVVNGKLPPYPIDYVGA